MERYCKRVLLIGKSDGKECICNFFNPSCHKGYNGECQEVECIIDKFNGLDECFKNKYREHPKGDI